LGFVLAMAVAIDRSLAVGRTRPSIAGIMALTLMVALNCMAARAMLGLGSITPLLVGGLPMTNALALGLYLLRRGEPRGKKRRFLVGFEVAGSAALSLYTTSCIWGEDLLGGYIDWMFSVARDVIPANALKPTSVPVASVLLILAFLTVPQLILALTAGWLAAFLRLRNTTAGLAEGP
jgi:hypothetical protein